MHLDGVFGDLEGRRALGSCIGVARACGSRNITNLESFRRYKTLNLMTVYDRSSLGHDFLHFMVPLVLLVGLSHPRELGMLDFSLVDVPCA